MLHPNVSAYGNWLLNTLTSPLLELGGRRAIPPQGLFEKTEYSGFIKYVWTGVEIL